MCTFVGNFLSLLIQYGYNIDICDWIMRRALYVQS